MAQENGSGTEVDTSGTRILLSLSITLYNTRTFDDVETFKVKPRHECIPTMALKLTDLSSDPTAKYLAQGLQATPTG